MKTGLMMLGALLFCAGLGGCMVPFGYRTAKVEMRDGETGAMIGGASVAVHYQVPWVVTSTPDSAVAIADEKGVANLHLAGLPHAWYGWASKEYHVLEAKDVEEPADESKPIVAKFYKEGAVRTAKKE